MQIQFEGQGSIAPAATTAPTIVATIMVIILQHIMLRQVDAELKKLVTGFVALQDYGLLIP